MSIHRRVVSAVLGAGAVGILLWLAPSAIAGPGFGFQSFDVSALNQDGSPDVQAGSHPYAFRTSFTLNTPEDVEGVFPPAGGSLKDIRVELPPGFVGNPNATPQCSYAEFTAKRCPDDTVVGEETTYLSGGVQASEIFYVTDPIYNIEGPTGVPAEFAYRVIDLLAVFLDVSVRTGGDYGLTVNVKNIPQTGEVYGTTVTFWGVPADPSHDRFRGKCLVENERGGNLIEEPNVLEEAAELQSRGECPVSVPPQPLLTNPTSCGVPRVAAIAGDTWNHPGSFVSRSTAMPQLRGCEKLDFSPSITVTPDGNAASTPTGLNIDLHVPQESTTNPAGLAEADVKNTTVTLPEGVQVSPSGADGLQACSLAQIDLAGGEPPTCPPASKVGTVEIDTPLLSEPLLGAVYLAAQDQNPFGSLVALYVVAEDPRAGVLVKLAGQVTPNPVTGQLVTTFNETPPLPFSDFKLRFFGTARAPLSTPPLCGTYATETSIEPWTGEAAVAPSSKFQITSGPAGAPCADPQPFAPGFQAGTTNIQAGAFTPFVLTMSRPDGDQTLSRVQMQLPPGLLGTLSNVKLCEEPQAAQGTCGEASLIGHTVVSAGLGNDPYTVTGGRVYITGPYEGAPYGLSIVNPAVAGPIDLGTVVVRARIAVDPQTAALTVTSDPLPTILEGIPLQLQHVSVVVERPGGFTFNPTNCSPLSITGTLSSSAGAAAAVATPFQATNCAALAFDPRFAVSTSGRTSRVNGASLDAKLTYPAGPYDANIRQVKVELPKQLPARLTTLQKACVAAVFEANPANCPAASVVGIARATTPVLPVALTGPAYFVSHGGEAFPSLIVVLQGYGTTVDLVGATFISKKGITSSTFKTVPDVPVGTFELYLSQGRFSALAANGNLCKSSLKMPTEFIAQNGAQIHQSTPIAVTGCAQTKRASAKGRQAKASGRRRARAYRARNAHRTHANGRGN